AGAMPQEVVDALQHAWDRGLNFRPLVIAPDRKYSQPGAVRVLFYQRPAKQFAEFERQEFVIPIVHLGALVMAILNQPDKLPQFASYQQTGMIRDLLVCTHGNYDVACSRFGYPIYQQLRKLDAMGDRFRVWRCSHFGGHEFAPTLIDLPIGQYWGHLEPNILDRLIYRNGDVTALRSFYRGWAGLTKFEQIAEREIWLQEGWKWLDYQKSGQVLAIDPSDEADPNWAVVQIEFNSPDGSINAAYEARIETKGTVQTMGTSGQNQSLEEVKQYRMSYLNKIDRGR
nr:sucrase ferredoxin [Elainella sp. Prado103]